ncbi:MAG: hypothetical protein NZM37_12645, partial [Sandaracinaceae bacterium]|nr:hypothetical protein [Sandaracinaceae bacterium]
DIEAYLYDIQTRLLIAKRTARFSFSGTPTEENIEQISSFAIELYREGKQFVPPSEEAPPVAPERKEEPDWWVWMILGAGALVVGGGIGLGVALSTQSSSVPDGWTRIEIQLP